MGLTRSYLMSFLLYISVVNDIRRSAVTCQDEEGNRCLPRKTFFALLRLPELSPNLAAYSRTARIIEDAKNRNELVNLKAASFEDGDDAEICLPAGLYLKLFSDPAMRVHLCAIERAQMMLEDPSVGPYDDENEDDDDDESQKSGKRSVATLAKNGDFPASVRKQQEDDEEEKRGMSSMVEKGISLKRDELESLIDELYSEEQKRNIAALARDYNLPSGKRNVGSLARDFALPNGKRNIAALARDYGLPSGKRNIAALARDYALPSGKRNIAALARDYGLPSGKRNIAALARDYSLPNGKRNIGALARDYMLPSGKRNIGALARDYMLHGGKRDVEDLYDLPFEKRYLGSVARNGDSRLSGYEDKRNIASLMRDGNMPNVYKRNVGTLARDWSLPIQNRYGRSLNDKMTRSTLSGQDHGAPVGSVDRQGPAVPSDPAGRSNPGKIDEQKLEALVGSSKVMGRSPDAKEEKSTGEARRAKANTAKKTTSKRSKRQIQYSDEYPLPVMQNTNVLDYEELMEALTGEYPNTEKRFMGRIPQMGPRPTTPPTRRLGR